MAFTKDNRYKIPIKYITNKTVCCCGKIHETKKEYYRCKARESRLRKPLKNLPDKSLLQGTIERNEEHSKILTEINLEGEFNTMATKLNKKKDEKSGKDYEYECGECGGGFNHKAEGGKCPLCGVELE